MGLWQRIVDFVEDKIGEFTERLRQWVLETLDKIAEEMRVWRFNFRQWLAEKTSTTMGFWLFIVFLIAVAVVSVYVQSTDVWLALVEKWKGIVERVKLRVGKTLAYTGYSVALAFHNLAMLFVPDYKAAWLEIYDGLAALSEEFRLGVSGVNNALRAARNLAATAIAFTGVPAVGAFALADEGTGKFLSRLESRLERYVRDPHLIFLDIDEELVAPAMEAMDGAVADILFNISNLNTTLAEKAVLLTKLQTDMEKLVSSMPEEIQAAMRQTWDKVSEEFDAFRTDILDPFIEYSAGVQAELDRQLQLNTLRTGENALLLAAPGSMLAGITGMLEPFRGWQARLVAWIAGLAERENAEIIEPVLVGRSFAVARNVHDSLASERRPVGRELVLSGSQREALAESAYQTWYVGEH